VNYVKKPFDETQLSCDIPHRRPCAVARRRRVGGAAGVGLVGTRPRRSIFLHIRSRAASKPAPWKPVPKVADDTNLGRAGFLLHNRLLLKCELHRKLLGRTVARTPRRE